VDVLGGGVVFGLSDGDFKVLEVVNDIRGAQEGITKDEGAVESRAGALDTEKAGLVAILENVLVGEIAFENELRQGDIDDRPAWAAEAKGKRGFGVGITAWHEGGLGVVYECTKTIVDFLGDRIG